MKYSSIWIPYEYKECVLLFAINTTKYLIKARIKEENGLTTNYDLFTLLSEVMKDQKVLKQREENHSIIIQIEKVKEYHYSFVRR